MSLGTRRRAVASWNALVIGGLTLASCLAAPVPTALAQEPTPIYFPGVVSGSIVDNSGLIPYDQAYFAFEVENVLGTLKEVPLWGELEAMLDNPYAIARDPSVGGNYQGFPSYRTTLSRRRSFVYRDVTGQPCRPGFPGCNEITLPGFVIHPLNYNHMSGEELRLLNVEFEGAEWTVPDQLIGPYVDHVDPTNPLGEYVWSYRDILVSAGEDRIEDDEAAIDFNSPIAPDAPFSLVTVEPIPAEGARVTGGDPGEPGYMGFGVLGRNPQIRAEQYSTPALPLASGSGPATDITPGLGSGQRRLYDPARGFISPRNGASGVGGLRKPTLRDPSVTPSGNPNHPAFTANSAENLEDAPGELLPSTENDYFRRAGQVVGGIPTGRETAIALGKALFWDMQVGSDAVQSCGSCHFHAGADNRTRNQVNPNHLGGDLSFQVRQPNEELVAEDFPFHKRVDPDIAGDGILNGALVERDFNDVASSMGVIFHEFLDIPAIGAFTPATEEVASVLPDLGAHVADPIPGFNGPDGLSAIRRVEPRNTPTFFGSAMNFDNFWDGRARHDFNGGSVFGASDPQHHVFVDDGTGDLVATRQIIRFASLASLATGPGLSEFEMSFLGRNWAKIGKKLLQEGVTPLANQLVATDDSVLGPFSNQGGSLAQALGRPTWEGKPGLAFTYPELIRAAFFPALWSNTLQHLNGGPDATEAIPILVDQDGDGNGDVMGNADRDPFDGYSLEIAPGPADTADTDQFTQMEANFSLFWGLSIHAWGSMLIPDDAPVDRFYDQNPDAFVSFGESNEKFLVLDLLTCDQTGGVQPCFEEVGHFKRDPDVVATLGCVTETCTEGVEVAAGGTRTPDAPDPLFGMDLFLGSNLSLKNPLYRSFRCGECHNGATLTDHTVEVSHQFSFNDFAPEFGEPAVPVFPEPLGRSRVIAGFSLESEVNGNAQDAIERNVADFCTVEPCSAPTSSEEGGPQGQALFDNGVYNIGVTPIANDIGRGGNDAFGWPLSLGALALKNIGGLGYTPGGHLAGNGFALPPTPGFPLPTFDPYDDPTGGGIFEPTAQDQQINPGFEEELDEDVAQLPPYLAPWASNINVGDETQQDEVFVGLNTLCAEPILEGFVDTFGPINPAATVGETYNMSRQAEMATWPVVNRVNRMGSFKAPSLRNVELTGPYFHNGGNLTLREQLDFYLRGGNFPLTNSAHRDFLIMNLNIEDEALGGVDPVTGEPAFTPEEREHAKVALVDFLLELTDERVKYERAPFDHPEVFVPLDGTAPMNTFGRAGLLALSMGGGEAPPLFRQVLAVGQGGNDTPLPNFLGISSTPVPGDHNDHYDRQ